MAIVKCFLLLFGLVIGFTSVAETQEPKERYPFETQQQRELFLELNKELRCPKCQNQNIADSNALISQDMKRKVHELVLEGNDKKQVVDFMKQRYGEFVHYKPPINPVTIWLYMAPLIFVALAGLFFFQRSRKKSPPKIDSDALKRAEKLLKEIE